MDHQKHSVAHGWTRFLPGLTLALTLWAGAATSAFAVAGQSQVGTGTAASCTFQSLKTAINVPFDPLLVTFNCGANPVVINVSSAITFPYISGSTQDITIDGGTPGLITLNATSGRIINTQYLDRLTVKNLTFSGGSVANCSPSPCGGGALFNPTGILTVIDSTFTGNSATGSLFGDPGDGGAIYSRGLLTVTGSTFTNNQARAGNGGAIYTLSATIANTRFSNNTSTFSTVALAATGRGGALYALGPVGAALTLVITGSSFTGNTAGDLGGAIFQPSSIYADSFVVTNSTFSGNSAQVDGGALAIGNPLGGGTTKVTNATISGNSVLSGVSGTAAGIAGSAVSLTNTIVSNNAPGNCSSGNPSFFDGGGNVVYGDTTCPGVNANSFLGSLTGTLPYFPLGSGSAAINRGIAGECAAAMASPDFGAGGVDQRGMPRRSLYCDSGAVEAQPASLAVVAGSNQSAAVNTPFAAVLQAQVSDSFNNKLAGSAVTFTGPASGPGIANGSISLSGPGGIALLAATANGTVGTYNVTVSATGATPANFSLTNRNPNGVTYDGNGETGGSVPLDGNYYPAAGMVTVLGNTGSLTRIGSTFAGWNTAANGGGTTYLGGASFAISANVILYARWTPVTCGVTYNANGSTGGTAPVDGNSYAPGSTVTVLANTGALVKTGSTFAGWNTAANGSGTTYATGATFATGSANVILYARWTPVTYGVTYNANGSTGGTAPVDGDAYAAGATVIVLGNNGVLVKTGSTFAGWSTVANGGTTYAGGATFAMGSASVILYALWTPVTFGVAYNANGSTGGTAPSDGNAYAPGVTVVVLGNTGALVKTGSTFAGWNTAANGTGTTYAGGATFAMGSANVILHALWTPVTYGVTYNANGSTGGAAPVDANAYAAGAIVVVLANTGALVKTGATFAGWNSTVIGTGVSYPASGSSFAMGSNNTILYAQWSNPCTLDLDGNNQVDAMTDGLMLLRAMFGLTGTAVTGGAIGGGTPSRPTWDKIQPYLNASCGASFSP